MFISLDDTKLFATSFGSKTSPPILALGGWIGSWEDWVESLSILSENWRVIAYDHRGSGVTICPVETITFDRLIDDVFVVLDAFGIEQCVVAAMSMGSAVALGAALRHPERISGLVLANCLDLRGTPATSTNGDDMFLKGLTHDYAGTLDAFINACVPEPDSDHIKQWGRHILNRASQDAAITLYKMSKMLTIRDELKRITQPTLLIHGDKDRLAPLGSAHWLAETLPNVTLKVIDGAGHVPILTRPHEVTNAIQAYFAGGRNSTPR